MAGQTTFHLAHFPWLNAQAFGNAMDFFIVQPGQTLLLAAQVEEQLALGLGGRDFHNAPVAQDELVNFRLDPMNRKRHQTPRSEEHKTELQPTIRISYAA